MNLLVVNLHVLVLLVLGNGGFGARILFHSPTPSHSHNIVYHPIIKELARRGHEVVSISSHPMDLTNEDFNVTQIDVSFCKKSWEAKFNKGTPYETIRQLVKRYHRMMNELIDMQLSYPEVNKLIHNTDEYFDLIIMETIFHDPLFGWSHRFNAPIVSIMSLDAFYDIHDMIGNPSHPYLYNSFNLNFLVGPDATFWERMKALYLAIIIRYDTMINKYYNVDVLLRKYFGEDAPPAHVLANNISLVIVNQNEVFNPRPKVPTFIYMNMMHIRPPQPLPQDLYNFLEDSTEGVVYFSLGSNVKSSSLPKEKLDIFLEVFSQLPVKVLWKFEIEQLEGKPPNVMICQWCPQQDILAHKNVKLFIMQGGLQSIEEGIYYKVPIIGMPLILDQMYNLKLLAKRGGAEIIEFGKVEKVQLDKLIRKVLYDSSYKNNMIWLSKVMQDQITKPLDHVMWWLEYVLRHKGAAHLRTPQLPWYLVLMLDAVAVVLLILFVATWLICRLSKLARKHNGALLSAEKLKAH